MSGGGERDRLSGASKQGAVWVSCLLGVIFTLSTAAQVLHWRALSLLSGATEIPVSASPCLPSELLCPILSLRILSFVLGLWLWQLLALTGSITSTTSSSLFFFSFQFLAYATFCVKRTAWSRGDSIALSPSCR